MDDKDSWGGVLHKAEQLRLTRFLEYLTDYDIEHDDPYSTVDEAIKGLDTTEHEVLGCIFLAWMRRNIWIRPNSNGQTTFALRNTTNQ